MTFFGFSTFQLLGGGGGPLAPPWYYKIYNFTVFFYLDFFKILLINFDKLLIKTEID